MEICIDTEEPVPLFSQLVDQIKKAVMNERVQPGDALPSIRQLAGDLHLNSKTVAKAYRLLERDSVIQMRGYRGTFVHPDAKQNCTVDLGGHLTEQLTALIKTLRESGITDSEIRIAFGNVMKNHSN